MISYYPGHNYVDWIGLDGYNYAGSRSMPWYTFRGVFGPYYGEITALAPTKPLMLVETANDESGGDSAA
jgi:beta-mannanase